jgi:hypothetical protein
MRALFTTVTVPAPVRSLITLDDLREQLRIKPNDTANDGWMTKVIARTSTQAEQYCNRIFAVQTYAETYRGGITGRDGEPLILAQAPVDPATIAITIDGAALDPANDLALDQDAGLVYRITTPYLWQSSTSLVVTYTAGFAEIPYDVQQAVLDLCTMDNAGRGRDPMLRAQESPGLGRQEFWVGGMPGGATIPQDIAGVLDGYRRGLIG